MVRHNRIIGLFSFLFYASLSFSTSLNQMVVTDPNQGSRTITYEEKGDYAVVEGDILIAPLATINNPSAVITNKIGGSRWPQGIIPFEISESLPFANKLATLQAIELWQKLTFVEFVELNSTNRDKYKDYISIIPANGTTCSSFVGKQGGKQDILLSPRCNTMNVVHELGHALGLWHEQSRADRNSFVRIAWENIEDQYKYNFDQQLSNGKDFGEYDFDSIMHYGPYSFSKNGQKTIVPLVDGVEIGQRNHLSVKDIAAVKAMYPEL